MFNEIIATTYHNPNTHSGKHVLAFGVAAAAYTMLGLLALFGVDDLKPVVNLLGSVLWLWTAIAFVSFKPLKVVSVENGVVAVKDDFTKA